MHFVLIWWSPLQYKYAYISVAHLREYASNCDGSTLWSLDTDRIIKELTNRNCDWTANNKFLIISV
jgi:hypothetical protein